MPDEAEIEARIRERAYKLWKDEGEPEGRNEDHWEQAKLIVAMEDAQPTMLKPINQPDAEPIEALKNQGEFPTLTDQGETQVPERTPRT